MAIEQSRFFDSIDDDREYSAADFAEYFLNLNTQGVLSLDSNLQVNAASGMNVQIGYGSCFIQGYGHWVKDDKAGFMQVQIPAASSQPRIDRIVVRMNKSPEVRRVFVTVRQGEPGPSPTAPELERIGDIYEISLAQVAVAAGATSVTSANITDERDNEELCGLIQPVAVKAYLNQGVKKTDSPTFANLTVTGTVTANKVVGAVYQ